MRKWYFPTNIVPTQCMGMYSVEKAWETGVTLGMGTQPGCEQLPHMNWGGTSTVCGDSEEK